MAVFRAIAKLPVANETPTANPSGILCTVMASIKSAILRNCCLSCLLTVGAF